MGLTTSRRFPRARSAAVSGKILSRELDLHTHNLAGAHDSSDGHTLLHACTGYLPMQVTRSLARSLTAHLLGNTTHIYMHTGPATDSPPYIPSSSSSVGPRRARHVRACFSLSLSLSLIRIYIYRAHTRGISAQIALRALSLFLLVLEEVALPPPPPLLLRTGSNCETHITSFNGPRCVYSARAKSRVGFPESQGRKVEPRGWGPPARVFVSLFARGPPTIPRAIGLYIYTS